MHPFKHIALAAALAAGGTAHADVVLSGRFLSVTINDAGHLGAGNAGPGLVLDPSGQGATAGLPDHLSPDTPFEGFGLKIGKDATVRGQANSTVPGLAAMASTSLRAAGDGAVLSATWSGTVAGVFRLTHEYGFGRDGTTLSVRTTVTALDDLKDVRFARAIDPDADAGVPGGTNMTDNRRGDAVTGVPPGDLVSAHAQRTGHWIELAHVAGGKAHATEISPDFSGPLDPDFYLGRLFGNGSASLGDSARGDFAIGLGYDLGNLEQGESVAVEYAYRLSFTPPATTDGGGGDAGSGTVPVPSTLALLGMAALAPLAGRRRRATR